MGRAPTEAGGAADFETVRQTAREAEPDRYLAALLAPRPARGALIALAALVGEVGRIPETVSQPMAGLVRVQWWRDSLAAAGGGTRTGHPTLDVLVAELAGLGQTAALAGLSSFLDGIDDALTHLDDVERPDASRLARAEAAAFTLVADLTSPSGTAPSELSEAAATAYGLARGLARATSRGTPPDPAAGAAQASTARRALADARTRLVDLPRQARISYLPLAMVEPYLRVFEQGGAARRGVPDGVLPLTRVLRLWRARLTGRP